MSFRSKNSIDAKFERIDSKGELVSIGDLIEPPGRYTRPPKIVFILRGLPGSGKTHFAKHIRAKENYLGLETPQILELDAYFEANREVNSTTFLFELMIELYY